MQIRGEIRSENDCDDDGNDHCEDDHGYKWLRVNQDKANKRAVLYRVRLKYNLENKQMGFQY